MPRSAHRFQLLKGSGGTGTTELRNRTRDRASLPQPGDVVAGKYRLERVLGEGGMGVVYEATHTRLNQRLAIKVLRPDVPDFHLVLARFEREARATAQLRTVHAARIIDVDVMPEGLPYIVMEFLEGVDLDVELQSCGPMSVDDAADLVLQVADAMTEAHGLGIVHRDLKPSNLFICHVGGRRVVKVLDFGISKIEGDSETRITGAQTYFGTPCYAAPEQLLSAADADERSDVWSLGIILYELLTGRPPFVGSTTEVIARVMSEPVRWPAEIRPDLPRDLCRVVMRALQRDREQRFQSMRELSAAIAPFGPTQSAAAVIAGAQRGRGRLGEILVTEGLLSRGDLNRALGEQQRSGQLLGRVLLDLGLVAHADLLTALAKQQGIGALSTSANRLALDRESREADTIAPGTTIAQKRHSVRWSWLAMAVAIGLGLGIVLALASGATRGAASVAAPVSAVPAANGGLVRLPHLAPEDSGQSAPPGPAGVERAPAPRPRPVPQPSRRHSPSVFEPDTL